MILCAPDFSLRGVTATSAISPSDIVMLVPADRSLIVTNNRQPTPFPEFVPPEIWGESLWFHRLAFKLLFDTIFPKDSSKNSWLSQLPPTFSTPLHWPMKDREALQYGSLESKIRLQAEEWQTFYERWQDSTRSAERVDITPSKISFDKFIWALECVNSRAFSGVYEGSEFAERQRLLIFAAGLGILWPTLQLSSWDQSISAFIVVAASIFVRDIIFAKIGQLKRYVLCPVVDMFNHKSTAKADVSYNYFSDKFEVRIDSSYQPGEQVFISYGKQSNDRLLQFYGFVDSDNIYDLYDFGTSIVELILSYADEMSASNPIPSTNTLTAQERLTIISAALENTQVVEASSDNNKRKISSGSHSVRVFRTSPALLNAKLAAAPALSEGSISNSVTSRFDELSVRAVRALYSSPAEWEQAFSSSLSSSTYNLDRLGSPLSRETERKVEAALRSLLSAELAAKPTTLEEDVAELRLLQTQMKAPSGSDKVAASGMYEDSAIAAIAFRIEKKKLLTEILEL